MRVVAGLAKGRRLHAPPPGTRPTSDQVREALFNSLATSVPVDGARVLDLYAGTGAVGLEALSRGASQVVLVESKRAALVVLRRNVAAVGLPGAVVVARTVSAFLAEPPEQPFDVVFADPPYELDDRSLQAVLGDIVRGGWLAEGAAVVVERSARSGPPPWPEQFVTPAGEKRYGDSVLWYGRRR